MDKNGERQKTKISSLFVQNISVIQLLSIKPVENNNKLQAAFGSPTTSSTTSILLVAAINGKIFCTSYCSIKKSALYYPWAQITKLMEKS
jgi:hypothetical protein